MHCATDTYDDLLSPKEFLEDQKNVAREKGNVLVVKTAYKPPTPVIVVLNWETKIVKKKKKKKEN
jgi:hypothetical protein